MLSFENGSSVLATDLPSEHHDSPRVVVGLAPDQNNPGWAVCTHQMADPELSGSYHRVLDLESAATSAERVARA